MLGACKDLSDYVEYVYRVREYAKSMPLEAAVDKAMNECIQEGILDEFLKQHKAEAKAMSIYEYNEEEHMRMEREESFEAGQKLLLELISKMSEDGLTEQIPLFATERGFFNSMNRKYME